MELALRVSPDKPKATGTPEEMLRALHDVVGALPKELRERMVQLDVRRIERAVVVLEAWWAELAKAHAGATGERAAVALEAIGASRFFHVTTDEGALFRFGLEAQVVGELFPEAKAATTALAARIDALSTTSARVLAELRKLRADTGWVELLGVAAKVAKA